jgi:hypothetical protein
VKLPEDKTERAKVLFVAVVGGVAVIYGAIFGIARPIVGQTRDASGKEKKVTENVTQARAMAERIEFIKKDNQAIQREISEVVGQYLLHDTHGNFLIGARRLVQQAAGTNASAVKAVEEVGVSVLERPDDPEKKNVFKAYTARVVVRTGFAELARIVRRLEEANPYLCISQLDILPDDKDRLRHQIGFCVQWPIWASRTAEEAWATQMAEAAQDEKEAPQS